MDDIYLNMVKLILKILIIYLLPIIVAIIAFCQLLATIKQNNQPKYKERLKCFNDLTSILNEYKDAIAEIRLLNSLDTTSDKLNEIHRELKYDISHLFGKKNSKFYSDLVNLINTVLIDLNVIFDSKSSFNNPICDIDLKNKQFEKKRDKLLKSMKKQIKLN